MLDFPRTYASASPVKRKREKKQQLKSLTAPPGRGNPWKNDPDERNLPTVRLVTDSHTRLHTQTLSLNIFCQWDLCQTTNGIGTGQERLLQGKKCCYPTHHKAFPQPLKPASANSCATNAVQTCRDQPDGRANITTPHLEVQVHMAGIFPSLGTTEMDLGADRSPSSERRHKANTLLAGGREEVWGQLQGSGVVAMVKSIGLDTRGHSTLPHPVSHSLQLLSVGVDGV
ncbi:hypothetical protein BaRGS_00014589 [Batillaria attramentaria]|uniref:Uncharacterized protein n=1 Tax=Batillaria attramentaria TaxID=370345 RepID=A0ABD0L495_9CAEN